MGLFSSAPKSEDAQAKRRQEKGSSGGIGSWFSSRASAGAPAPTAAPAPSSRPAVTEAPESKGLWRNAKSNASKLVTGEKTAHSGDSLPAPLRSLGRAAGIVETEAETAARRAKKARNAHLGQIMAAGEASTARQAGLDHETSSPLSESVKADFVRDQHLSQIRKAGAASAEHQAGKEHDPTTPIASVTRKEYLRDHPSINAGLHGGEKLDDIYARSRLKEGTSGTGNLGVAMQHFGEEGYEAVSSSAGSAASSAIAKATGHNVQELAAHTMNASRIVGGALAARDPGKNLQAAMANAEHGTRMDSWHGDVEEMRRKKESGTATEAELRAAKRKALFGGMKAAASNQRLAAARFAVNKDVAPQWEAKDTVGEDATRFGYAPGAEIKASDRDNGSIGEQIKQGAASTLSAVSGGSGKAFDTTKLSDTERAAVAKTKETTAGIKDDRDKRNAARAANPEAQGTLGGNIKRFLTTGTAAKLTGAEKETIAESDKRSAAIDDEAKKRRESPDRQKVSAWQAIKNFGSSLIPGSARKLGDWRGLTAENQGKVDAHNLTKAKIEEGAAADGRKGFLWGHRFTAEEKLRMKQSDAAIAKITAEQSTGYSAKNLNDLAKEKTSRDDVRSVASGGFTSGEKQTMAAARKERADIKTHAREHSEFATAHDGKTVGALGHVGGMNTSSTATAEEGASTLGGRLAQGVRGVGRWLRRAGRIFGGKSADADAMIKSHDMTGAALTTTSGIAGEVGAAVATATTGTGTAVAGVRKGVSGALSGTGETIEALSDPAAHREDRRNQHAAYHSGARFQEAKRKGVDIRPTFEAAKAAPASLTSGISTALTGSRALALQTEGGKAFIDSAQNKAKGLVEGE